MGGIILIVATTIVCCYCRKRRKTPARVSGASSAAGQGHGSARDLERGSRGSRGSRGHSVPASKQMLKENGVHAPHAIQLQSFDPFASSYNSYKPAPSAAETRGSRGPAMGPMATAAAMAGVTAVTATTATTAATVMKNRAEAIEVNHSPTPTGARDEATAQWLGLKPSQPPTHKQSVSQSDSLVSKSSTRLSSYDIDFASISLGQEIGKGSFGKIFTATWNETPVAVKFLVNYEPRDLEWRGGPRNGDFQPEHADKLQRTLETEAEILSVLRHPNIVQYLGVCMDPSTMCIVTEYCGNGSLAEVVRTKTLSWSRASRMLLDAGTGMLYLHSRNILHCDLKSNNILVDSHYRTKICDFNMSKLIEESTGSSLANIQNPRWLAPEICEGIDSHSKASDVYAFGIIMWEVLTREVPWKDSKPWEIVQLIKEGGRPTTPNFWDCVDANGDEFTAFDEYVQLLTACWDQNPYARPTFNDIVRGLKEIVLFASSGRDPSSRPGDGNLVDADASGAADPRLFSNSSTRVFFSE